jgi:class 3 adenylate cyclase
MKAAKNPADRQTRMAAVVFADLVGFSKKTVPAQLAAKEALTALLQRHVAPYPKTARVILDTGDGAAVGFLVNPESALGLALRLRRELEGAPADALLRQPDLRLGINLGPVKVVTDLNGQPNILGEGINSAERIMSFADPGHTTASRSFQEAVFYLDPTFQSLFEPLGTRADKHGREHEVFRLTSSIAAIDAALQSLGIGPSPVDARAAGRSADLEGAAKGLPGLARPARVALVAGALVIVAATAAWYAWPARRGGTPPEASTPPAVTAPARPEQAAPPAPPPVARPEPPTMQPESPPAAASAVLPPAGAAATIEPAAPQAPPATPPPAVTAPRDTSPPAPAAKRAKTPVPAPKGALAGSSAGAPPASARSGDASPTPVRSSSPRCTQLLQRAAVGEALTPDEQRELGTTCR